VALRPLELTYLGTVEYDEGLDLQEELRARVASGEACDQLLLLEHPPVVTIGKNAREDNVVFSSDELARRGIELRRAGRGGDVTFHGPGQLVGYPILNLDPDRRDVHRYVRDLEEVIIRTLGDFGVASGRIPGLTGVWIGDLKVAAIGVRISRWVTTHGFAFNVRTDLDYFDAIVPCGIRDRGVTSLSRILRRDVAISEVRERLAERFAEVFERAHVVRHLASESIQTYVFRRKTEGLEVLLLRRTAAERGFWQPVTGLLDEGETPARAAHREVEEETGIRGEIVDLEYVRDFRISEPYAPQPLPRVWINREHAFAMETSSGLVKLAAREHDAYVWASPARARELLLWKGNLRALERLERWLES
jgi:lipoyl(octanoyl) transferase